MSVYKTVDCVQLSDQFLPGTNVNFRIPLVNLQLEPDSVYFSGNLTTNNDYGTYTCSLDNLLGANAIFDDFIVNFDKLGKFTDTNVPRFLKNYRTSNWDSNDVAFKGSQNINTVDSYQRFDGSDGATFAKLDGKSFKIKPHFTLNNANKAMTFTKCGNIDIQVFLRPTNTVFYTNNPNLTYRITNLKMHYKVSPDTKDVSPIEFRVYHAAAPALVSGNQRIQTTIGSKMLIDSISASFLNNANMSNPQINNFQLDPIGVTDVKWEINDTLNGLLAFSLKKPSEIYLNGISALNKNGLRNYVATAETLNNTGVQIVGLRLPNFISLVDNTITMEIKSTLPSYVNPFTCYLFFEGKTIA